MHRMVCGERLTATGPSPWVWRLLCTLAHKIILRTRKHRRSAINRAAEEIQQEHPGSSEIVGEVATFENGAKAVDFAARLIYCQELGVFEIIAPLTTKAEIVGTIKRLMKELDERKSARSDPTIV